MLKDYKFSDDQLDINTVEMKRGEKVGLWMPNVLMDKCDSESQVEFYINKDDAIALCEHFELLPKVRHDQQVDSGDDYEADDQPYTPQVGEECEVDHGDDWIKSLYMGLDFYNNHTYQIIKGDYKGRIYTESDVSKFRPLKTERDIAIEKALALDCEPSEGMLSRRDFVGAMYDAGLIK